MKIASRVMELAEKHSCEMARSALAWYRAKGVASPIIGAEKAKYPETSVKALGIRLTPEDIAYPEEACLPRPIVGMIDINPARGVILPDEKIITGYT